MRHLSHEQLLTAAEGGPDAATAGHMGECARCRDEVLSLQRVLREVRAVDPPEPSPLFWSHLTARVRERLDAEPPPRRARVAWPGVTWWAAATSLAAGVAVLLALVQAPAPVSVSGPVREGAAVLPIPATADRAWQVVLDAAGESEGVAGIGDALLPPGYSERALLDLSADEDAELERLLEQELERTAS